MDGRRFRIDVAFLSSTGYAATMTVRLVANGMYSRKGLSAPEHLGRHPECVEFLLKGLRDRGVVYRETIEELP